MTEQDKHGPESLADGLANWTPPWARRADTDDSTPPDAAPPTAEGAGDVPEPAGPSPATPSDTTAESTVDAAPSRHFAETAEPTDPPLPPGDPEPTDAAAAGLVADPAEADSDEQLPEDAATPREYRDHGASLDDTGVTGDAVMPDAAGGEGTEPGGEIDIADVSSPVGEEQEPAAPVDLRGALEAILLVVDEPVADVVLAQILEQPTEAVAAALHALADEYTSTGRGFDLRRAAGGWRLYTRTEYAPYVERFVLDGQQVRLTQAALETLAVVAYKQPVTRPRISAIRGVNCDGVIRTLLTRGLIEECGAEPDSGAHLYRTTPLFCEKLGIDSIDDLPPLAPFLPDDLPQDLTDVIDTARVSTRGRAPEAHTAEPDATETSTDEAGAADPAGPEGDAAHG